MKSKIWAVMVETEGNEVATDFQGAERDEKAAAVRCWQEVTAGIDDKVLAVECGMTPSHYSKVATGQQGDLLGLVYRLPVHRAGLRQDFLMRLVQFEEMDPMERAADQLALWAVRFLRARNDQLPQHAGPPLKAELLNALSAAKADVG